MSFLLTVDIRFILRTISIFHRVQMYVPIRRIGMHAKSEYDSLTTVDVRLIYLYTEVHSRVNLSM